MQTTTITRARARWQKVPRNDEQRNSMSNLQNHGVVVCSRNNTSAQGRIRVYNVS